MKISFRDKREAVQVLIVILAISVPIFVILGFLCFSCKF